MCSMKSKNKYLSFIKIIKITVLLSTFLLFIAVIAVLWFSNRVEHMFLPNSSLIEPKMIEETIADKNNFTKDEYIFLVRHIQP